MPTDFSSSELAIPITKLALERLETAWKNQERNAQATRETEPKNPATLQRSAVSASEISTKSSLATIPKLSIQGGARDDLWGPYLLLRINIAGSIAGLESEGSTDPLGLLDFYKTIKVILDVADDEVAMQKQEARLREAAALLKARAKAAEAAEAAEAARKHLLCARLTQAMRTSSMKMKAFLRPGPAAETNEVEKERSGHRFGLTDLCDVTAGMLAPVNEEVAIKENSTDGKTSLIETGVSETAESMTSEETETSASSEKTLTVKAASRVHRNGASRYLRKHCPTLCDVTTAATRPFAPRPSWAKDCGSCNSKSGSESSTVMA